MKKLLLLIIILSFSFKSKAQSNFIVAGQHGVFYYDIVPDTFLAFSPPPGFSDPSYSFDINNDGIKDIKIDNYSTGGAGFTTTYQGVTALNSNTSFAYAGQNVVGPCGTYQILKQFFAGDTIQNTSSYISTGYLSYRDYEYGSCNELGSWGSTGEAYIGVKYQTNASIAYGWVKVNIVNVSDLYIEEYSLGAFVTGINQFSNSHTINIYPNPVKDMLNIGLKMLNEDAEIKITDLLGNEVISTKQNQIDVSNFNDGVYFVQVKTSESTSTQKIVVQH